jgi:cation transport regulator ChaC
MDPTTEIASGFAVGRYQVIRQALDPASPETQEWSEVLDAFQRRIEERFLRPIIELLKVYDQDLVSTRPGFAILALDCLLIDTIQSFREGRVSTNEVSTAVSFRNFLSRPIFNSFSNRDRQEFIHYVRNGLLHNGETRGDWKVNIRHQTMLFADPNTGSRTINPRLFHAAIVEEFEAYRDELEVGSPECRKRFLRRMDAICGLNPTPLNNVYFAYGSNLLEAEIRRDAPDAELLGVGFLPCYKVVFTKHSNTRNCDTASIEECAYRTVWGYLYRLSQADLEALRQRERGYTKREVTVWLVTQGCDNGTPVVAFTFVGDTVCPRACGPNESYLSIVVEGARSRRLPEDYVESIVPRPHG